MYKFFKDLKKGQNFTFYTFQHGKRYFKKNGFSSAINIKTSEEVFFWPDDNVMIIK